MLKDNKLSQVKKELNRCIEGLGEIMTLGGTAKYLKIGKSALYKMTRESEIPIC